MHRNGTHPRRVPTHATYAIALGTSRIKTLDLTIVAVFTSLPGTCLVAEEDAAVKLQMVLGLWWLAYD